ncbi:MAG: hypothetical protein C4293_04205 [Nitrospiraceae bacterium]
MGETVTNLVAAKRLPMLSVVANPPSLRFAGRIEPRWGSDIAVWGHVKGLGFVFATMVWC